MSAAAAGAAAAGGAALAYPFAVLGQPGSPRAAVAPAALAEVERQRVIAAAEAALLSPVEPLPAPTADLPRGTFVSHAEPGRSPEVTMSPAAATLKHASMRIAALTAAFVLTTDDRYALGAGKLLYAWFIAPATRLLPDFDHARCAPGTLAGTPAGVLDAVPLAEIMRSLPFLADTAALSPPDADAVHAWFKALAQWSAASRTAELARYAHDHVASAMLLLDAATARLLRDDRALSMTAAQFRKPTLRLQVHASGSFPNEVATAFPYRFTLLNFELLAATCNTLTTPFDSPWTYELADGPGMRAVAAYLYPKIANRATWPWPADAEDFRALPGRRHALLLAGRAYAQPAYVELWRSLPDVSDVPSLQPTLPITQPLLWVTRPPHGA